MTFRWSPIALETVKVFYYGNYFAKKRRHSSMDAGTPARMTGLIVQYLKMNIFLGVINTFTVSLAIDGKQLKLFYS